MKQKKYPLENLFSKLISPFDMFLNSTTTSGFLLFAVTIISLTMASKLGNEFWHHFWEQKIIFSVGDFLNINLSWHHFVNDGLMALFFLLVGLELKREVLVGELSSISDAILPVVAAIGGMVVPALIYTSFNIGSPSASGWGIPMATDIAFAIGILVLLSWRVPKGLIIFLTALAIADDLGSVLVIAIFYTKTISWIFFGYAAIVLSLLLLLNRGGIRHPLPYILLGIILWFYVLQSGIHATLAGIILAMIIPARPFYTPESFDKRLNELYTDFHHETRSETPNDLLRNHQMATIAESLESAAKAVQSPLQRIEHTLSQWVAFLIIPVFAFANANIDLTIIDWKSILNNKVTVGVITGLVLGKFIGISLFSWLAVKTSIAQLPNGIKWKHILGAAWLGGIGFTMSLFVSQLAFENILYQEQAKIGVLIASFISAIIGLIWLIVGSIYTSINTDKTI
jgi:NhaA family Na+:H+ antiporter